jgi:beta-lactam-binding protein with PASTA domain
VSTKPGADPGIAATDATQQLTGLGFNVAHTTQANGTTPGTVLDQSITGAHAPGSTIVLTISTGRTP